MSYFDDNEDRIIYGGGRRPNRHRAAQDEERAAPGSPLAAARIAAHAAFDPLWKSGKMSRSDAYGELARRLGIRKEAAHMVLFDIAMCERVVALFLVDDFEDLGK